MARIYRRPNSRFYWAAYKVWDAAKNDWREHRHSLHTEDEQTAAGLASMLESLASRARSGEPHITRQVVMGWVSDLLRFAGITDSAADIAFDSYASRWLHRFRDLAPATETNYRTHIRQFSKWSGSRVSAPLDAFSPDDMQAFYDHLRAEGRTEATAISAIKTISRIFSDARDEGLCARNPAKLVRRRRGAKKRRRDPLTPADLDLLLAAARRRNLPDWETMCLLGWFTGARIEDCSRMRWENITEMEGVKVLHWVPGKRGGQSEVMLPIVGRLHEHLAAQGWPPEGALCPSLDGMASGTYRGLSAQFIDLMDSAGVVYGKEKGPLHTWRSKSFHSFRHAFAQRLAAAGVPEDVRMALLDHSSKDVHRGYARHGIAALHRTMTAAMEG